MKKINTLIHILFKSVAKPGLLVIILFPLICSGQKQGDIWYFGNYAGVDFNSGNPVALTNGVVPNINGYSEGCSAISDNTGNILMYSNGMQLWNKNNQVMPNGDSLWGNFSATQSSIIVPLPGSSRYFYVFTVDDYWEDHLKHGVSYSVVDMCLDNGLGDVMPNNKNIPLLDTVDEKIAAVRHANGQDYWIVTHKLNTNRFYAYLLTSAGITDTVVTPIGVIDSNVQGQLKISANGKKLAMASGQSFTPPCYLELFNFDNSTGIISGLIPLTPPATTIVYGVEFSPDNSKFFAQYGAVVGNFSMGIAEYDISSGNQATINASMTSVYNETQSVTISGLQLGPNGKIYMINVLNPGYLLAINSPDSMGSKCNVQDTAVYLAGEMGNTEPPTFIAGYSYSNTVDNCTEGIDEIHTANLETGIYPNPSNGQFNLIENGQLKIDNEQNTVEVYNMLGEKVYSQLSTLNSPLSIDLTNQPNGIYLYRVITETGSLIGEGKAIIQR